ncbi:MAG: MFS transporter [Actinomycetota bacterium]
MPLLLVPPTRRRPPPVPGAGVVFAGLLLMMLSGGLQGSLVSLRGGIEGFSEAALGIVAASYYVGFVAGTWWGPSVVRAVGHVRVFSALASLASASVLVHLLTIHPVTWSLVRALTGLSVAGLYVVVESWLNDLATNETRGRVLGLYAIVTAAGLGGGQVLLVTADPGGIELFLLASILVSLALVPIALGARSTPHIAEPSPMGLGAVLAAAPLGVVGAAGAGLAHSAVIGLGAVYARDTGHSLEQTAAFMAVCILGGVVLQMPLSRASDHRDRRGVIAAAALAAAGIAALIAVTAPTGLGLLAAAGLFGALAWPMYSLSIAHTNDWLSREQMIGASATLVLAAGAGSIVGPLLASVAMSLIGPAGLFATLALSYLVVGLYALHRMTVRPMAPRQRPAVAVAVLARTVAVTSAVRPARRHRGGWREPSALGHRRAVRTRPHRRGPRRRGGPSRLPAHDTSAAGGPAQPTA